MDDKRGVEILSVGGDIAKTDDVRISNASRCFVNIS
jgi:hypothetical protein